jgi:hypothetical protein
MKKTGYAEVERRILKAPGKIVLIAAIDAAIGVLAWTMATPHLVCQPINAAESAAGATLKNIQRAEEEFRERRALDTDGDGKGGFGWLGELAGITPLRSDTTGRRLDPPVLSKAFGEVQTGHVQRSDYLFCLWLPSVGGGWARQGDNVPIDAGLPTSDATMEHCDWGHTGRDGDRWVVVL